MLIEPNTYLTQKYNFHFRYIFYHKPPIPLACNQYKVANSCQYFFEIDQ